MSKKDYIAFAKMLREELEIAGTVVRRKIIERLARRIGDVFSDDNPRFDYDRFMSAIGIVQKQPQ